LNHPNIAGIYDLQEANSYPYLVLELVEGKTLADRIARGAIPVEDSLKIARSICKAIEAAHEKDIVHRDLKPANVKLSAPRHLLFTHNNSRMAQKVNPFYECVP